MLKPEGLIPALVTPFTEDFQLNEQSLRRMVRRFIDAGMNGLFCLGTNGEFFSLSQKEKIRIAEIVVEEANGSIPVYMGTGGTSTAEVIQLNKEMQAIGVSAVSVITPYFPKLTQEELIYHYTCLADATELPILLYNIPSQTGNNLSADAVSQLSREENIVGIKDSSGSFDTILQYIETTKDSNFSVLAGTDSLILSTLMAGGTGAIAATANFLPNVTAGIYEKFLSGDMMGAEGEQQKLRKIRSLFKYGSIPAVLKESLNQIGLEAGPARLPILPVTPKVKLEIEMMIQEYVNKGVLEGEAVSIKGKI